MIQHLFVNLERTIHDRLNVIQEVMQQARSAVPQATYSGNTNYAPCQDTSMLLQKIYALETTVQQMNTEMASLREKIEKNDILPLRPIDGIEVIPKRYVVLETDEKPLSFADRLLLNKKARKALEAEEMVLLPWEHYGVEESIVETQTYSVYTGMPYTVERRLASDLIVFLFETLNNYLHKILCPKIAE